jgi:sec-independent protein translocase protein TatB
MPGFQEMVVLFVIGLLILGPERLPRVATQIGRWIGRARRTAHQLRYQLERELALAEINEIKNSDCGPAARDAIPRPEDKS